MSGSLFSTAGHQCSTQHLKNDSGRPTKQQHAVHRRHWPKQVPALHRSNVAVAERCVVYKGKINEISAGRCNTDDRVSQMTKRALRQDARPSRPIRSQS